MNMDDVEAWVDGYTRAWATNDPKGIGSLFSIHR